MSDSVTKWHEMQEDKQLKFIYESPDGGETITRRPFGSSIYEKETIKEPIISEGVKKQAYNILIEFPEEAILEAARILRNGK